MTEIEAPLWLLKVVALGLGAVFGSFANVLIYRLPRGESIIRPSSHCPFCKAKIRWYHNIPVLSYVALMGRCAFCKAPISLRYPLIEICLALLSLASLYRVLAWAAISGPSLGLLSLWAFVFAFCFILVVVTFIDLEHWIIPPVLTVPGIGLGLLFSFVASDLRGVDLKASLLGVAFGALPLVAIIEVYRRVAKREGMGYGDVFLMAMVGAFLGIQSLPFVFFASALQGLVVGLALFLLRRRPSPPWEKEGTQEGEKNGSWRHVPLPFGPFIALSALEWLFFEDLVARIFKWY